MKTIFTAGEVAKICKVAPRTVFKWFDSGRLRGYRIPGSQDRRIPREHLIRFLKEHGMPLDGLAGINVLLVGLPTSLQSEINRDDFNVLTAIGGFEAGIQAEGQNPDCVVIDFSLGALTAVTIASNIRTNYPRAILIGLVSPRNAEADGVSSTFDMTIMHPINSGFLISQIETLVHRR